MNFELFDLMTRDEAQDHLQGFLDTEGAAMETLHPAAEHAGILMDYSLGTLPSVLKWIGSALHVMRVPVADTEPDYIREYHKEGLIDFPEESKYLILRAAYYMGESFVRANEKLFWTIGDPEYIQKHMPVVAGFREDDEMAPMMVCKNVFSRVYGRGASDSNIDALVRTWVASMP